MLQRAQGISTACSTLGWLTITPPPKKKVTTFLYNYQHPQTISLKVWFLAKRSIMGFVCLDKNVVALYGEKKLRRLFWRAKAEIKRQVKTARKSKQRFSFHYDPLSYSLNFDNGNFGFFC